MATPIPLPGPWPPVNKATASVTCLPTAIITSSTNLGPLTTPTMFPRYVRTNSISILPAGDSVRFCCPIGYICPMWPCFSICATLRVSATTALVVDNIVHQSRYSTETLPVQTRVSAPYDYAYPIRIRWKDSDFAAKTNSGTTPTETSSGSTRQTGRWQLSTGTIAAMAVVAALLALVSLILGLWWLRKKRKANLGSVATEGTLAVGAKGEMDGSGMPSGELDTNQNQIYELET
ncbi:hypothetical protein DL98DRAFT_579376 [Cadophora sp. DSE1049]|nr:hypothetical protein DL98DRAFT_579376 [Cadophora sp. DSE1049]